MANLRSALALPFLVGIAESAGPGATLRVAETVALIRRGVWPRFLFSLFCAAIAAPFAPLAFLAFWVAFVTAWEFWLRPWLEMRFAAPAGARAGVAGYRWLAAINLVGASAYCAFPVVAWMSGDDPGRLLAVVWMCASASHVLVYFAAQRLLLAANLLPMFACAIAAPLAGAAGLAPMSAVGAIALIVVVLASAFAGYDQRELLRALARSSAAHAAAEEASSAKSRFLALASHELRTPLNAVIGYAEIIEEGGDTHVADARRVLGAAHRLRDLVDAMLDISRIEAGLARTRPGPVSIAAIVGALRTEGEPLARVRGNQFSVSGAAGEVFVDAERLRRAAMHLIANAAQRTEYGIVDVTLDLTRRTGGRQTLAIRVRDTGAAIAADRMATMFDPAADDEGTDLGLAAARLMARQMGGEVVCENVAGQNLVLALTVDAGEPR